jgi:aerobic carbon-monoxide dehydrogenase medium subunit
VKPAPFQYYPAKSVEEATTLLGHLGGDGHVLAGGQSLLPMMNFRLARPEHLVDINPIAELSYVRRDNGHVVVGALARQAAVERSDVAESVPLLVEALKHVAHPTIRHRGTVVGSIAHADPAAELPCVAVALDGEVTLTSARGERTMAASDFLLGPFATARRPDELVTEVSFPVAQPQSGYAFAEFTRRHGDFAVAGAAVAVALDGSRISEARIALCGVGPRPLRAEAAEARLLGEDADDDLVLAASAAAVEGLEPPADVHGSPEYRARVARAQVRKALTTALGRAREAGR